MRVATFWIVFFLVAGVASGQAVEVGCEGWVPNHPRFQCIEFSDPHATSPQPSRDCVLQTGDRIPLCYQSNVAPASPIVNDRGQVLPYSSSLLDTPCAGTRRSTVWLALPNGELFEVGQIDDRCTEPNESPQLVDQVRILGFHGFADDTGELFAVMGSRCACYPRSECVERCSGYANSNLAPEPDRIWIAKIVGFKEAGR